MDLTTDTCNPEPPEARGGGGGEVYKMSGMEGGRELEQIVTLGRAGFNTGSNIGM